MSAVVLEKGGAMGELVCRFCPNSHCPGEGHYKIQTTDGEFLGNVGTEELDYELSVLRQNGYSIARIIGGEAIC